MSILCSTIILRTSTLQKVPHVKLFDLLVSDFDSGSPRRTTLSLNRAIVLTNNRSVIHYRRHHRIQFITLLPQVTSLDNPALFHTIF